MGGEKQSAAVTRAFLKNIEFQILDESMSKYNYYNGNRENIVSLFLFIFRIIAVENFMMQYFLSLL